MKKFISVLLALILVCCSLPFAAALDEGELRFRADGSVGPNEARVIVDAMDALTASVR